MALYGAEAVTIDRNVRDFKVPDQMHYDGTGPEGLTIENRGQGPVDPKPN
jgi:hypothetical protein